jgi:hypothetical protein
MQKCALGTVKNNTNARFIFIHSLKFNEALKFNQALKFNEAFFIHEVICYAASCKYVNSRMYFHRLIFAEHHKDVSSKHNEYANVVENQMLIHNTSICGYEKKHKP